MPPGSHRINTTINFGWKTGITLRGAGDSTVLADHCTGRATINIGGDSGWAMGKGTAISGVLTKGSTKLTVANPSGLAVGQLVFINQDNDPNVVWDPAANPNLLQQVTQITAINGNSVSVWPLPIGLGTQSYIPYSTTTGRRRLSGELLWVGKLQDRRYE